MKPKTIVVVTGTRAEYGVLRSTMDSIQQHPHLSLRLLVTGMHTLKTFGHTKDQIERDGYHIDHTVSISEDSSVDERLAQELVGISKYLKSARPDCVVVLGDRDEPLAAAIAAQHLNIPLAHIHGGDATGPGVDESNRHMITKLSHLHFPATAASARRIKALGEEAWRIQVAGTPGLDMLGPNERYSRAKLAQALSLEETRPWMTIAMHPTAFDTEPLASQISSVLSAASNFPEHEKILLYPNNDKGAEIFIAAIKKISGECYHIFESLPRKQYISAIAHSDALVGNSSSGIIEAAFLGTPAVDVGNRQKGRERGTSVIHAPYDSKKIVSAIKRATVLKKKQKGRRFTSPYGKGTAGKKIAAALAQKLSKPNLLHKKPPAI